MTTHCTCRASAVPVLAFLWIGVVGATLATSIALPAADRSPRSRPML
jgi:hypothetical protein